MKSLTILALLLLAFAAAWTFLVHEPAKPPLQSEMRPTSIGRPDRPAAELDRPAETDSDRSKAVREVHEPNGFDRSDVTDPTRLLVRVSHPNGAPGSGLLVLLVDSDELIAGGRTGFDGQIELEAALVSAELVVVGAAARPHRERVPDGVAEIEVTLPGGAILAGTVRVDGKAPDEPVELSLQPAERDDPALPEHWRSRVPAARNRGLSSQDTGARGAFCFSGLPAEWSGEIEFSEDYLLAGGGGDALVVERPQTGLVIDLVRRPALTGRVLDPSDMSEVVDAQIFFEFETSRSSNSGYDKTEKDGRFSIPLPQHGRGELSASLTISSSLSAGRAVVDLESIDREFGRDVGDVFLKATRDIPFLVLEASGAPIAGVVATVGEEMLQRTTEPTGEDGLGMLQDLSPEDDVATFLGFSHEEKVVSLPAVVTDPLRVVLDPSATLEIVVRDVRGNPVTDCVVVAHRDDGPLFSGAEPASVRGERVALGGSRARGSSRSSFSGRIVSSTSQYAPDESGRVVLPGVSPEADVTIRVVDAVDAVLAERHGIVARRGERRVVEIELELEARAFVAVFKAPSGDPVSGVRVRLRGNRGAEEPLTRGAGATTDENGRIRIESVFADSVDIAANHADYAHLVQNDVSVPADGDEIELWLERPESIVFSILRGGELFPHAQLTVVADGQEILRRVESEDGRYRLERIPPRELLARISVGGRTFEHRFHGRAEQASFEVPTCAKVRVEWSVAPQPDTYFLIELEPEDGAGETQTIQQWFSPERFSAVGEHVFEAVFPGRYTASMSFRHPVDGEHVAAAKPVRFEVVRDEEVAVSLAP